MTTLACLLAFAAGPLQQPTAPETVQYQNDWMEIRFQYPKTWQVTTNKKGESRFLIPIAGSPQRAVLELYPANFHSEKDVWQLSQTGIAKSQKRTVDRQWEEEILGVPLLLTKTTYVQDGIQRSDVSGLLYSWSNWKMMYRLTATPDDFDKADFEWRQALQTMRTYDDKMPRADDPGIALPQASKNIDGAPSPTRKQRLDEAARAQIVKAPLATTAEVAGKKVEVHLPAGWKVEGPAADGTFTLRSAEIAEPITLRLASSLDGDPAIVAVAKASATSLDAFSAVDRRDENRPRLNKAASSVVAVWREGKAGSGALLTCDAVGENGDFYYLLTYRTSSAARFASERKAIENLIEQMSVEPAP